MNRKFFLLWAFIFTSCSSAPVATPQERNQILNEMVKERAAFDMQCPFPQLRISQKAKGYSYSVKGCQQQLTYMVNPDCQPGMTEEQIRRFCYFSMNIDTQPTSVR